MERVMDYIHFLYWKAGILLVLAFVYSAVTSYINVRRQEAAQRDTAVAPDQPASPESDSPRAG